LLIGSSLFYTSHLFAYAWFSPDDYRLVRRIGMTTPITKPICTDSLAPVNLAFYLLPRQMNEPPCPDGEYFVLQRPSGLQKRSPSPHLLQKLFASSFQQNIVATSFLVASGIEIIKSIPSLERALEKTYRNKDSTYYYATLASRVQAFIDNHKLEPITCSTNFCLYKTTSTE
ncbi:MAG: hypothetical protein AAB967_03655, partial [Patescibacteria group bacterium]